jgi:hypothetical protein
MSFIEKFFVFVFGLIAGLVFALPLVVGYCLVDGIVLSVLWTWFAVPIFGLPSLGIAAALGVSLVWNWLCPQPRSLFAAGSTAAQKAKDQAQATKQSVAAFFEPLVRAAMTLLLGYVIHLFV